MQIQAQNVLPGDRVRGVGLIVEYAEPHTDFSIALVGQVSSRDSEGEYQLSPATIVVPNSHLVNVVRADANFRADQVSRIAELHTKWVEDEISDYEFESGVFAVAAKERKGEMAHWGITQERIQSYNFDTGFDAAGFYAHVRGEVDESPEGLEPAEAETPEMTQQDPQA